MSDPDLHEAEMNYFTECPECPSGGYWVPQRWIHERHGGTWTSPYAFSQNYDPNHPLANSVDHQGHKPQNTPELVSSTVDTVSVVANTPANSTIDANETANETANKVDESKMLATPIANKLSALTMLATDETEKKTRGAKQRELMRKRRALAKILKKP